jgi:hypothetical protein
VLPRITRSARTNPALPQRGQVRRMGMWQVFYSASGASECRRGNRVLECAAFAARGWCDRRGSC